MEIRNNKWSLLMGICFLPLMSMKVADAPHPIHVSVTEINHNATEKTLEISCKLFTDDFEKILSQVYKTHVDLTNPTDRAATEKLVNDYIIRRLSIKGDGKVLAFAGIGFEKDNDAVYAYFQSDNVNAVKNIDITNTLMFDLYNDQISLMHVIVGGQRKSGKLDYPEKEKSFSF